MKIVWSMMRVGIEIAVFIPGEHKFEVQIHSIMHEKLRARGSEDKRSVTLQDIYTDDVEVEE